MYRGLELQRGLVSPLSTPARHTLAAERVKQGGSVGFPRSSGSFLQSTRPPFYFSSTASIGVFIALVLVLLII